MTTTKTITIACIPTNDRIPSIWDYNTDRRFEGVTLIPTDMSMLAEYDMKPQEAVLTGYAENAKLFEFNFEYVTRDGFHPCENARRGEPDVELRTHFWRQVSGDPKIDFAWSERSNTGRKEFNYGCSLLKQLNEGLSHMRRGRYIANIEGKSVICQSTMLRRSPTVNGPYNCGNPLVGTEKTEVDYDTVYEYYYGMYGTKESGMTERDDQDAVATFDV